MKNIWYYDSIVGRIGIIAEDDVILGIPFNIVKGIIEKETDPIKNAHNQLDEYFMGLRKTFSFKIKFSGTSFQQDVYYAMLQIPYGQTVSYSELAQMIGRPKSYRAVGNAAGKNRLPIIVPCHRVIANDGSIGGFTGGIGKKMKLLRLEKENM